MRTWDRSVALLGVGLLVVLLAPGCGGGDTVEPGTEESDRQGIDGPGGASQDGDLEPSEEDRELGGSGKDPLSSEEEPADCTPDSPSSECSWTTCEEHCPPRACEDLVGCRRGECLYEPVLCFGLGASCPVLGCQAEELPGGGYKNICAEVPGASCGSGGRCNGQRCEVKGEGLRVSGGLRVGSSHGTITDAADRRFSVSGHLGFTTPQHGSRVSNNLRLSGGLRP